MAAALRRFPGKRLVGGQIESVAAISKAVLEALMRRIVVMTFIAFVLSAISSCGNKETGSDRPHATIQMRDGSTLSGVITTTSPTQMTLAGDDNLSHTVPTAQVKSIDYDQPAAPAAEPSAAQTRPPSAPKSPVADRGHENHYHPSQAEIHTKTYELAAGSEIPVRSEETVDSAKAVEGQTYAAEIADDVRDPDGNVVVPRGSNAQIVIRSASKGGRFRGASDLVLDLQSITVEGQQYVISTTDLKESGKPGIGANVRTGEYTGGGAALGAIIGAIAGGGKGAAIGAGAGAGAGVLTQVLTKGASIRVPAETILTFKLDKPVRIVAAK
jgi:hypothetical protein